MKNYITIGLGLAIIIMAVLLYSNNVERAIVEHDLKQSVKFHESRAKEFEKSIAPLRDSVALFHIIILNIQKEKEIAHQETVKWRDKYEFEKGKRIGILSDASYDSAVNSLYPH